jgi:hypothetical protein
VGDSAQFPSTEQDSSGTTSDVNDHPEPLITDFPTPTEKPRVSELIIADFPNPVEKLRLMKE